MDFRKAIESSKNIYQDVINKELPHFDELFADEIKEVEEQNTLGYERLDG